MPGFDRTGPMGQGPTSGRGFGPCGRGYGFRRGSRRPVYSEPTKDEEKAYLEAELKAAEGDIKDIKKRLQELK